jgi:hypothetical protein
LHRIQCFQDAPLIVFVVGDVVQLRCHAL